MSAAEAGRASEAYRELLRRLFSLRRMGVKLELARMEAALRAVGDPRRRFREDGLRAIAEKAMERKTGARGLRSILEGVLLDSMYNIPSQSDVIKVVIDESVIRGDSEPLLVYQNTEPAVRAASTEE